MLQLAITYIWFALNIPREKILQFESPQYPVQVLVNPIKAKSDSEFQAKSLHYKFSVLQNGGIYADFSTPIHYQRLMARLNNFTGEMWVAEVSQKGQFNFVYIPSNKTSIAQQIMDEIPNLCGAYQNETSGVNKVCSEIQLVKKFKHRIKFEQLENCVGNKFDSVKAKPKEEIDWTPFVIVLGCAVGSISVIVVHYVMRKLKGRKQVRSSQGETIISERPQDV